MRYLILISLGLIINLSCLFGQSGNYISGKLKISEQWESKIYLSEIQDFNNLYRMSNSMIIAETELDSLGFFKFETNQLPAEDRFYRLHVSKKDAPKASLIIGGKEQNFTYIIANKFSSINFESGQGFSPFDKIEFSASSANTTIQIVDATLRSIDSLDFSKTQIKRSFVTKASEEKLRFVADTSSNALASLYAVYKSNFKNNVINHKEFYSNYLDKWENEESQYFKTFKKEIRLDNSSKSTKPYIYLFPILAFIVGFMFSKLFYSKKSNNKVKTLSIQERKIFKLLRVGKSNKEISEELNIGVSTVKSHVSNIYSKLGVKSRKDIVNLEV